jgi:hypothetical protein
MTLMRTGRFDMQTHRKTQVELAIDAHCARGKRRASAGVVVVEYAFLLVFFCAPVMLASAALGIHMIKGYGNIRNDQLHVGP